MSKQQKADSGTQSNKDRVARRDGKCLLLKPKPANYDLLHRPKTEQEFIDLANEFFNWSKNTKSTNINDFPINKKISPYRFKRIDHEYFQDILQLVKYIFAGKNRELLLDKQFDKDLYFKELYQLDTDFREDEQEKMAKRNSAVTQGLAEINLVEHMLDPI